MTRIIDAHCYVGRSLQGYEQSVDALLSSMDKLDVATAVICAVRPIDYAYAPENDRIAEAVASHAGRFVGLGRVDARRPDAADEAKRCLTSLGMKGIHLHPWEDCYAISDPMVDPVMEVCKQQGAPVLVAAGYPWLSEALQIAELARRFPEVPIVMTNGAQINISGLGQGNAWATLATHPNTYVTTSGVYREDFIEEVMENIGASRVLFSSQSPLFDQDFELHRILWAHVSDETKAAALSENAERIFGA